MPAFLTLCDMTRLMFITFSFITHSSSAAIFILFFVSLVFFLHLANCQLMPNLSTVTLLQDLLESYESFLIVFINEDCV